MFLAAAFVPDTALLVPGAGGRADVLADLRADALAAVQAVLATRPQRIVVVAPGLRDRAIDGPVRPGLGAAGVPDRVLGWVAAPTGGPRSTTGEGSTRVPLGVATMLAAATTVGVAASVAVLLVQAAGGHPDVQVVEVAPAGDADALRARGARIAADDRTTGYVVAGSLSARHGPDAPLADDARAVPFDADVLCSFADGGPGARDALAALDGGVATALAVSGWAPWQVLLGALDRGVDGLPGTAQPGAARPEVVAHVLGEGAPFGGQYLVATWLAARRASS